MKILITCPFGLSSLLTSELKHLGYKPFATFPTGTYVEGDQKTLIEINLRSRVANKVFLQIGEGNTSSFDQLFDMVSDLDFEEYLYTDNISITAFSQDSKLFSTRSIQSICHKAILKSHKTPLRATQEQDNQQEIFVRIEKDLAKIFVNSSGKSLHNRGWRTKTGNAPLKENIAAGLILLGGWKFKEKFLDPFCGSGTLCIEAAMIAKNIAPGLKRNFTFEYFPNFDDTLLKTTKETAKSKIFNNNYEIFGSDRDKRMIETAQYNAKQAGVSDCIQRNRQDFEQRPLHPITIITNPPYGKRLEQENLDQLYTKIIQQYESGSTGGFLTSFPITDFITDKKTWKTKQINNNSEMCTFWRKIN